MKNKIHVLHIIQTLALGGAEVNLLNLVNALDPNRFEVYVAYSTGGELEAQFKKSNVKLFKFANSNYKIKSFYSFGIIILLVKFIIKNRIQIIQSHTFNVHIWAGIAAKITGIKIIEHVHDFRYLDPSDYKKRRGENQQYKFVNCLKNFSDCVIVLTKQNYNFLISKGLYPISRVRELQNGIPLFRDPNLKNVRINLRKKWNIPDNALIVLTPVRIALEKNVDLIFRIAPKVIQEVPQVMFIVAGDGPLFGEFKKKVKSLRLENNVRMIGFEADIKGLLSFTEIFLLPSFLELHSIAVLEAMSIAVPVLISKDVGCNSEFIQNWENGILLDPFKDEGWAEALIKLLKDANLRQQIGEAGYLTCKTKFDIKNTTHKIEGIYNELC